MRASAGEARAAPVQVLGVLEASGGEPINEEDYALTDAGYLNGLIGWVNGDFNYDGIVSGDASRHRRSPVAGDSGDGPRQPAALRRHVGAGGDDRDRTVHRGGAAATANKHEDEVASRNLKESAELTVAFCKARLLSPDGRCRTFR